MRSIPEERLKRRQSDNRKETAQRAAMWLTISLVLIWAVMELSITIIKKV